MAASSNRISGGAGPKAGSGIGLKPPDQGYSGQVAILEEEEGE